MFYSSWTCLGDKYHLLLFVCDSLWENPPLAHKDKYWEIRNSIIQSVVSQEGLSCILVWIYSYLYKYSLFITLASYYENNKICLLVNVSFTKVKDCEGHYIIVKYPLHNTPYIQASYRYKCLSRRWQNDVVETEVQLRFILCHLLRRHLYLEGLYEVSYCLRKWSICVVFCLLTWARRLLVGVSSALSDA